MLAHALPYFTFAATHLFSGVSAAAIGTLPNYDEHGLGSGAGVNKRNHTEPSQDENTSSPTDEISPEELAKFASAIPDDILDDGVEAAQDWLKEHLPELRKRDFGPSHGLEEYGLTLDEAANFASVIPNDILDDSIEAAQNWLKEHLSELRGRDLGSSDGLEGDGLTPDKVAEFVSTIPDDILDDGVEATQDWLKEHHQELAARHAIAELERRDTGSVFFCTGSILWCLGLNSAAVFKVPGTLLKLEKFRRRVVELGGPRKTAKLLIENLTKPRGKHQVPGESRMEVADRIFKKVLGFVGQEFLSTGGVAKYCFDAI